MQHLSKLPEINTLIASPINPDSLTYADNPQPRCPVILLLDCSSSMEGPPIIELNRALQSFYDEVREDPVAVRSVELSIITFGQTVDVRRRFSPLTDGAQAMELVATGRTPLGAALRQALADLGERRSFYRQHGLPAYQPWIVLLSDGQPNDEWRQPAEEALALCKAGQLTFIGVGIGPHVDLETLRQIVGCDPGPYRMEGLRFRNFFRWLRDSLRLVTQSSRFRGPTLPADDWIL